MPAAAAWPGMLRCLVPRSLRAVQAHTSDTLLELAVQVWVHLDASHGLCARCGGLQSDAATPLVSDTWPCRAIQQHARQQLQQQVGTPGTAA